MSLYNLNDEKILEIVNNHTVKKVPRFKRLQNIFEGKHEILNRKTEEGKPNNKIILDFPGYITNIMIGYFLGKPVTYTENLLNGEDFLIQFQKIMNYNNEHNENVNIANQLSIKGEAFELLYIDDEKNICFTDLKPDEVIVHYEPNFKKKIDLAIRYYNISDDFSSDNNLRIEVYTPHNIRYYTKISDTKLRLDNEITHYFGEVPIIHYFNNNEKIGDWEKVISLINDLESRLSDNANELEAFRNAYIIATGFGLMEPEEFKKFKEVGAMMLPDKDDKVEFLTKNVNDDFSEHHIKRIIQLIHKLSMVPDLSDESFVQNLSGIAIQFKLYCMEQIAAVKEQNFKQGLIRRIKLITNILNFKNLKSYDYNSIIPMFVRNIPANLSELADIVYKLKGTVSDETLLSQFPFISDVNVELERLDRAADKEVNRDMKRNFAFDIPTDIGGVKND